MRLGHDFVLGMRMADHNALGRVMQRDPLEYVDEIGLYEYSGSHRRNRRW